MVKANPEHVEIVKKGAAAIEEWRRKHPKTTLQLSKSQLIKANLANSNLSKVVLYKADLFQADLSRANLSKADVSCANLFGANLTGANLDKANLSVSNLIHVNLAGASLVGANLRKVDLSAANLSKTNLSGADLTASYLHYPDFLETNLSSANLTFAVLVFMKDANLTNAVMHDTTLVNCNLAKCVGLETVKHEGPNSVDFRTLVSSFRDAGNRLTSELATFLLNSGLPKDFVETLPKILAEVRYCSSFVCYGSPDLKFAKKLRKGLMAKGVPCWLYSLDAIPGERTWREITSRRREAEKMIVLCSAEALIRDGVLKEIEEQIDEDPDKIVPISLDDTWKQDGFLVKRGQRDLKPFLLQRNYADLSDQSKYNESLLKLLKGLKRKRN